MVVKWMNWLGWRFKMPNRVAVGSGVYSDSLALFWRSGFEVGAENFLKYHID